jgi:beta-galactosidase
VKAAGPAPAERFVTFRFLLRRDAAWAPAGHEVARQQLALPGARRRAVDRPAHAEVAETPNAITLEAGGVRVVVDRHAGLLTELSLHGRNALLEGPRLQVWRAPTDNDGFRLLPERRSAGPLARWLELGLDRVEQRLEAVRLREDGAVEIVHAASGRGRWTDVGHRQVYRLLARGELLVENEVTLDPDLRDLPRIGVVLLLPAALEGLEWFGRGPWECYPDRLAATVVGRFAGTVTEQYVPYILPQEHGHRMDARRISLVGDDGFGIGIEGRPRIGFSASHFTAADLYAARHTCDLEPRAEVVLSLDHAQRGLGTASCGPDTALRHRLLDSVYRFGYVLRVVDRP